MCLVGLMLFAVTIRPGIVSYKGAALCGTNRAIFCDLTRIAKIVTKNVTLFKQTAENKKRSIAVYAKKQ